MRCTIMTNGFPVEAEFSEETVQGVCRPLLEALYRLKEARKEGERAIALLAAPPAAGKSTLAGFLEALARGDTGRPTLQALGLDGFHFPEAHLKSHTALRDGAPVSLKSIKGAPETFDVRKLRCMLSQARTGSVLWPWYDRRRHDVVEDVTPVTGDILLVEGNWMLLDEPAWRDLPCDMKIFVSAPEELLYGRLVARKMRGGLSREEAEAFCRRSDLDNVRRCLACRQAADLELALMEDGELKRAREVP